MSNSTKPKKKFRLDKWARQSRRKLDRATNNVVKHGKRFLIERWDHIRLARRDVILWLCLMLALIVGGLIQMIWYNNQVTTLAATVGGTYAEGVVDKLTTINPLYANTDTEKAASQLVYPGLLSYDDANKLHGELATSWTGGDTAKSWTVKLKPNLTWSDGQPLTAADVIFTVSLMKNSDINANLATSWNSIEVTAVDDRTIEFKLTSPLATFDHALTFGILPKHILDGKSALDIASLTTTNPGQIVGAGPFRLDTIENESRGIWHFIANDNYYGGKPKLREVIIHTYTDNQQLANGLNRGEVNAISDVGTSMLDQFNKNKFKIVRLKTSGGVYALFNNAGPLTSDSAIREALRLGLNRDEVRRSATSVNDQLDPPASLEAPLATGIYDSVDQLKQPGYNDAEAKKILDQAGWVLSDGSKYRTKGDQTLTINIVTIAGTNYELIAGQIADQWRRLGVDAQVEAVNPAIAQQNYLSPRNYDVLVYQIDLGADPDVYAYWSSTQTDTTGLNLANYTSKRAEISLSGARTAANEQIREARYLAFVNQWLADNPAIALYQPSLFYVMDKNINTLQNGADLIDASNRFQNISNWTAKTSEVMKTP